MSLHLLLFVMLLLAGCGGLSSEPEIVRTAVLPTVTPIPPPDLGYPPQPVNLARGAAIYNGAQGCQACHGPTGQGNGPTASAFTCKLPDFTSAEQSRGKTVNAWFAITTNGNNGVQQCLMPPWKSRLNEQQRWDASSYIYSLHYSPDVLTQGKQVWQDKCAVCHGDTGKGNGPKANDLGRPVRDLTDPQFMIAHSDTDLFNTVTKGMGTAMPAFADLDEKARWAVVAYARSLSWDTADVASNTTPATQQADTATIRVGGKVTNGTTQTPPPEGLALTLRVVDVSSGTPSETLKLDTKTAADGTFSFGDQARRVGMVYVVTTNFAGVQQNSNPIRLTESAGPALDLSFAVYEIGMDPAMIHIDNQQMFLSLFSQNTLQIQQATSFTNTGNRLYVSNKKFGNQEPITVEVPLPNGAQQVQLSQGMESTFVVSKDIPPVIQGIAPVSPTFPASLQFSYLQPYTDRPFMMITAPYALEALTVFMPQISGLVLQDPNFAIGDPLQLADGVYNRYTLQRPLRAGEQIRVAVAAAGQQAADKRNTLAVVLVVAALLLIGTLFAIVRLNRQIGAVPTPAKAGPALSSFESLVQNIADLDDRYERGKIKRAEYDAERARLKAALAKVMEGQS